MSKPTRLLGALDNDVNIAVGKFLELGISADVDSLYTAIQRSNSSIKRKPKKVLQQSIERCLDFRGVAEDSGDDSEAALEKETIAAAPNADLMNRSLRANLSSGPSRPPSPPPTDDVTKKRRAANGEALPKRQKTEKVSVTPPGDISLYDIGGIEDVLNQLKELLVLPLLRPRKYIETNVSVV